MSASETESQFESFRSAIQSEFPPHSDDDPETGTAPRVKGTSQPVTEAVSARSPRRELMVKRAELGVRVCEMVLCLISLSVMVADRSRGWSGDSYYRYKEYRSDVFINICVYIYICVCVCVYVHLHTNQMRLFLVHYKLAVSVFYFFVFGDFFLMI